MADKPQKPEIVRPKTFEEMTASERALFGPRNRQRVRVPETIHEYNPLRWYDDEVEDSFHRKKPE